MAVTRPSGGKTNGAHSSDGKTQEGDELLNEYEKLRQERIRANLEHFQKLGINSLTLELSSVANTISLNRGSPIGRPHRKISPKPKPSQPFASPDLPLRRSSRLQNGTPVVYEETSVKRLSLTLDEDEEEDGVPKRRRVMRGRRVRPGPSGPELYTEEHEKLLGNTEKTWELFVDGCGADGRRIYDSVNGKTCHQCRQKTLGLRTFCSSCQMRQGQFCGDCLYMRYGEHVLEAIENADWICPVCRGICNCSFCRTDRGWAPTGNMYRKVVNMGYRSVAHYLIQTKRAPCSRYAAKRSLDFMVVVDEGVKSQGEKEIIEIDGGDKSDPEKVEIESNIDEKNGPGSSEESIEEMCIQKKGPMAVKKKKARVAVQDCIARRLRSRKATT